MSDFTQLSKNITHNFTQNEKKNDGIFFTPPSIILTMIERIKSIPHFQVRTILEPSCGSCEIIHYLNQKFENIHTIGIEKNTRIFEQIGDQFNENLGVSLLHRDFLQWDMMNEHKFNLIIGNPPYFVVNKADVNESFYDLIEGRPNIFVLFLIHALPKLEDNGVLAFVLPRNFINCAYYSKIRKHIYENFAIIDIIDYLDDSFVDTKQDTLIFILQKKNDKSENKQFSLLINNDIVFNIPSTIDLISKLYQGSVSLYSMGFDVKVGTVVWNQCKDILTDDDTNTRLIYSGDIKNNSLDIVNYKDPYKKNYIMKDGNTGPMLLLNRGYGKGKYVFSYCLVDMDTPYLIENHVISIRIRGTPPPKEQLLERYNKVIQSFCNEKTKTFVDLYFGNNAINTTELKHILPIYV
jgi:adenine-specific DNA-methyltransferase